jgi:uncharacterized protein YjdB
VALLALLLAACQSADTTAPVGRVQIAPATPTVALGETVTLTATVVDGDGTPLTDRTVVWSSANPDIAEVNQSGLVTPHAAGRVEIAASSEGQSAVVEVQVLPRRVASVSLSATRSSAEVGDTIRVTAVARAADDEVLTGRTVSFTSSAADVATVDAAGRVVGRSAGSTRITGTVEGVSGNVTLTFTARSVASVVVTPDEADLLVGRTVTLRAQAYDRDGVPLPGSATFTSSASGIARVTSGGVVTAVAPGTATITASIGGVTDRATIRVSRPPAAQVTVTPLTASIQVGERVTLTAVVRDASGDPVPGATVTWRSATPAVATVSSSGVVTGVAPGGASIVAESGSLSGTASVTVSAVPVASVSVSPSSLTLDVGGSQQFSATPRDADGDPLDRAVSWSSSAPAVASVSSTGLVQALSAGSATITATSEGKSGQASLTVRAVEPPSVPTTIEKVSGDGQVGRRRRELGDRLVVRVLDQHGQPMAGVEVRWTTSNGGSLTPESSVTDERGEASTKWKLGNDYGLQAAQAVVDGVGSVVFSAIAVDE